MPRVLLTQQIVDEGTFALNSKLKELGSWNDLSIGPDGRYYANKSPGPSFVAIPAYLVAKACGVTSMKGLTWAFRVGAVTIPAILFLPILFGLLCQFTTDERAKRVALIAYAFGSPAFVYSLLLMGHQLAAICLGTAVFALIIATKPQANYRTLLLVAAGFMAGFAPLMDYQATLVVPALGIYLLVRSKTRIRDGATFCLAVMPGPLLLGLYHYRCFGSPFRISYGYGLDTAPKEGVLGFVGPNFHSLHNILTTPSNGLLFMSPWLLFALVGLWFTWFRTQYRAQRAEVALATSVIVIYVLFVGSMLPYMARGGWSAGARQLVATLPFLAMFSAVGFARLQRNFWMNAVASGLVLSSVFVFCVAATTYPHWPDQLANPLFELSLPLLRHNYAVHNAGELLGIKGTLSLLPLYALVSAASVGSLVAGSGHARRLAPAAFGVAALVLFAYAQMPKTGPYAQRAWNFVTTTWEPAAR